MENRTIEDFVEDMISDGRNLKQILAVAASSRWTNSEDKIKETYEKLTGNES